MTPGGAGLRIRARRFAAGALAAALLLALASCRGKCYIEDASYLRMRENFTKTGSLQYTLQKIQDEGWRDCEREEFLYRLRKDLDLEPQEQPFAPPPDFVP